MASEKFSLRWNDFENNINSAFKELREEKDFLDVTLVCNEGQIQAHKVILSACSPFFKTILRRNPHQHPLLYLQGVSHADLQSVLSFMYQGEVSVAQEELNSFLAVAENLKVKGLTQQNKVEENQTMQHNSPLNTRHINQAANVSDIAKKSALVNLSSKIEKSSKFLKTSSIEEDPIQEVFQIKSEPKEFPPPITASRSVEQPLYSHHQPSNTLATADDQTLEYSEEACDDYEEYSDQNLGDASLFNPVNEEIASGYAFQDPSELLQFVRKDSSDNKFHCTLCDKYSHKATYSTRNHVESHHFPNMFTYQCDQCDQAFSTKSNYSMHRSRKHRPVRQ